MKGEYVFILLFIDWRIDGYRWFQNGSKPIPSNDPKIRKIYFVCMLPSGKNNGFRRFAYFEFGVQTNLILLHYVGDHQIALEYPRGNSRHSQPYYRTCPSVLQTLKSSNDCPGNVYKKVVASNTCLPNLPYWLSDIHSSFYVQSFH